MTLQYKEILEPNDNLLTQFYYQILSPAFPDKNELNELNTIQNILNRTFYHIVVALDEQDTLVGGIIFDYFKSSKLGMIEYIAVHPEHTRKGFASQILDFTTTYLKQLGDLRGIVCEVNRPIKGQPLKSDYLFWRDKGFKKLNVEYIQLPLEYRKVTVDYLDLIIYPYQQVLSEHIENLLNDYASHILGSPTKTVSNVPNTIKFSKL